METGKLQLLSVGEHTMAVKGFNDHLANTPLVFLHGVTMSLNFWVHEQTPALAAQRWYSMSLPGHYPGAFPQGFRPDQLTPEMIADVTASAIQQVVGDTPVILAGHSTGGFTAVAVAARHPQRVKAAVCISGFAHGYWTGGLRPLQIMARMGRVGRSLFEGSARLLSRSPRMYQRSLSFDVADSKTVARHPQLPLTMQAMYPDILRMDAGSIIAYFNRMPDIDITAWLANIQAPTLVLAGDHDPIVPPEQARIIARHIPHSTLRLFPAVGHLPMIERPDEYHEVVGHWVSSYL